MSLLPPNQQTSQLIIVVGFVILTALNQGNVLVNGQEKFRLPPQDIVDIIDAPPVPGFSLSPDRQWMLLIERDSMPGIEDLARRMIRLAGMRIDPIAEGRFMVDFNRGLALRPVKGGQPIKINLGPDVKISGLSWSHKSDWFAVLTLGQRGQQLWSVSVHDPENPKLLTDRITTVTGGIDWMPDGKSILCNLVPQGRGAEPLPSIVPSGPNVQESYGNQSPIRTYQDLLSNPDDEALFEHYATSQIALIGLDGKINQIGQPAIYSSVQVSPDGNYLLLNRVTKPFSYLLTMSGFPKTVEVIDLTGKLIHTVAEIPMAENIPIEGVQTGPRSVTWKPGEPNTLVWLEALDGGDPNQPAEYRDRLMKQSHPFSDPPMEVVKTEHRAMGFTPMADPNQIVVTDYDRDRRWVRGLKYNLADLSQPPVVMVNRNIRDRYNDPGSLVTAPDEAGFARVLQVGDYVFRIGQGSSPQGDLPFVDRQNLTTLETDRLWRCDDDHYEYALAVIVETGTDGNTDAADRYPDLITSRESTTEPANLYYRDLAAGSSVALTEFPDPTPQIRGIHKEMVTYTRSDGVGLSATLYLPADYKEGDRLPLVVWAYPQEFSDASTAGQISGNPNRFVRMAGTTHLTMVTQGYAIMDSATMPIIGDPETMNDTFVQQIVSSAQAAIDYAVERGVADRDRVGVGGHSYGAFMTANLLAHSDLFKAGIARSGAFNRTLTPFGFQAERRDFWKARDIYMNLSPFTYANQIQAPILFIHGEEDNNSGTFPIQSQRMFQAVKGNGGNTRLVMLPYESHGYRARESVLHTQAEMIEWFDRYLKWE